MIIRVNRGLIALARFLKVMAYFIVWALTPSYYFCYSRVHPRIGNKSMVDKDTVIEALKLVEDPELFLDIWFLGLIYEIAIDEDKVAIDMTFTTPMCPAGPALIEDVRAKVGAVEGVSDVEVKIVFEPPWEPSDEVKAMLGMM